MGVRLVLDAARGHVKGIRLHRVARELLVEVRSWNYAKALYKDDDATLDDIREAVTTLEDAERIARRVLGGANPTTTGIEIQLQGARLILSARESS